MKTVEIRLAKNSDVDLVMSFIKENWGSNHILANSKELMHYMHSFENEFRWVIAESDGELCGVLAYFLFNEEENPDICGGLWKTINNPVPLLGTKLILYLCETLNARQYVTPGANPNTALKVFKFLGYQTGKLSHYYRLNDIEEYNIATVNKKVILPYKKLIEIDFVKIKDFNILRELYDFSKYKLRKPYKSSKYINYRYFQHPVYKYIAYFIKEEKNNQSGVFFAREIEQNNSKILRIVDYIGADECIGKMGEECQKLINLNGYEYIDFYQYGIENHYLESAGFCERTSEDCNIIPNYFEPFVQENIDIYFSANPKSEKIYCFKGDGDQDRPSI